MLFFILLDFLL